MVADLLALPGLPFVLAVTFVAGLIYGFAGFGAALIYMPLATIWLPLPVAVAAFSVAALSSLVTVVPGALPHVNKRSTAVMLGAALVTAPLGITVLRILPQEPLRWGVAATVTVTLMVLITGWRYRAKPNGWAHGAVGAGTGLIGGATGLTGPVVILFHLSGQGSAQASRAGTAVFLTILSLLMLPQLWLQGVLTSSAVILGLCQLLPYAAGSRLGQALFDPAREVAYRRIAYSLIALSVVLGLPIF